MRIRIAFLLELILALAVGMGLARANPRGAEYLAAVSTFGWGYLIGQVSGNIFEGFALVVGLATLIERVRGRSPSIWGPGRWALSVICIYAIFLYISTAAAEFVALFRVRGEVNWLHEFGLSELIASNSMLVRMTVPWFLLALGITYRVVRPARDPSPDAREWAGRVFAALVVVVAFAGLLCGVVGFSGLV